MELKERYGSIVQRIRLPLKLSYSLVSCQYLKWQVVGCKRCDEVGGLKL
jgi:hypothetical protein